MQKILLPETREYVHGFDIEKVKDYLDSYIKDKSPTKISCFQIANDSSDSSDSNSHILFARFVRALPKNNDEKYYSHNKNEHEDKKLAEEEQNRVINCDHLSIANDSDIKENTKGLPDTVTTVNTVTDSKDSSSIDDHIISPDSSSIAGQNACIEESNNINNNTHNFNRNDDLTIYKNNNNDLTHDNNPLNPKIGKKGSIYYCKTHPKFESIHLEVVENHLLYSKEHSQEHPNISSYYNRDMEIQSKKDNLTKLETAVLQVDPLQKQQLSDC